MKRRLTVAVLSVLLVVATAIGFAGCGGQAAQTGPFKWKAQAGLAVTSYQYLYQFKPFVDTVNQRSNGRLTIELFAPGAVVDALETFGAVQKGVVEVGMGVGGYVTKWVPEGDIEQGIPGTFPTDDAFMDFFLNYRGGAFYNLLEQAYQEKGAHLLKSPGPSGTALITKQPIKTVDEIKGKKIRASGSYLQLAKNLGASPVELASAEVFMAIQTGTVDGTFFPTYTIGTMKLWDAAKGLMLPTAGPTSGNIYVSAAAYNALPADLKKIVEDAGTEAGYNYVKEVKARTQDLVDQAVKSNGVTVTNLPTSEYAKIQAAGAPIAADLGAKSARMGQLVQIMNDCLAGKK